MISKKVVAILLTLLFVSFFTFAAGEGEGGSAEDDPSVEVLHWWTSGGEAAALKVLKDDLEGKGIEWIDSPVAGGSGVQAMTALRARVAAGNPPTAIQTLGFDLLDWAKEGVLANLNPVAEANNWEAVVPDALKAFSKYDGNWIAAPVNVHSVNWVWANQKLLDELNIAIPETWDEYVAALETAKNAGKIALAHGGQPWQDATVFDAVLVAVGGVDFYKSAILEQDLAALGSPTMVRVFEQMKVLRGYVDSNFSGRDWNLASAMVINGDAVFQMMGDWAKGEFLGAGLEPDVDFVGFRTPGTKGVVMFNSDQFAMFNLDKSKQSAQAEMAKAVMSPKFQIAFNTVKGSVPARTDVPSAQFDLIGQKAMQQFSEAAQNGTLVGSLAHGYGAITAVKNAVFDVVTAHFNGEFDAQQAVRELVSAVREAQ